MRLYILVISLGVLVLQACNSEKTNTDKQVTTSAIDMSNVYTKISYAWGVTAAGFFQDIANLSLKSNEVFVEEVINAMREAHAGNARMDSETAQLRSLDLLKAQEQGDPVSEVLARDFCYAQGIITYAETKSKMNLAEVEKDIDFDVFFTAVEHQLKGSKLALSLDEVDEIMMNLKADRLSKDAPSNNSKFQSAVEIENTGGFDAYNDDDKISYALGANAAYNIRVSMYSQQYESLLGKTNWDLLLSGMQDAIMGNKLRITKDDYKSIADQFLNNTQSPENISAKLSEDFSYGVGMMVATSSKDQAVAYNLDHINNSLYLEAATNIIKHKSANGSIESITEYLNEFAVERIQKKGEDFLAQNKLKPGITTTATGLQYEVLKMGTGTKPTPNNTVRVHYHGTLINGTVFDSSVDRDQPAEFSVLQVISGWIEGLQLMPVGSKFKLYIPQNLAYGATGQGNIPPYSALIFEVELLDILQ